MLDLMLDPIPAYYFVPGTDTVSAPLVLLHGSGGNEYDLIPLVSSLAPKAAKLGIRGTLALEGRYAFFHRLPDRRVKEADIEARAPVLVEAINAACAHHHVVKPLAVGFSNGAIMAAVLFLAHPGTLAGAILFRPLSPFTRDLPHRIDRTSVLILDGENDSRRSPGDGLRLAERLVRAGALVTHHILPVGHSLTAEDERIASLWLQRNAASYPHW